MKSSSSNLTSYNIQIQLQLVTGGWYMMYIYLCLYYMNAGDEIK